MNIGPKSTWTLLLGLLAATLACRTTTYTSFRTPAIPADSPFALVLGTAQDGGLPQIGCVEACCGRARNDPAARRRVTALLLVDPVSGGRWLFDASPDIAAQVQIANDFAPRAAYDEGARAPLFDGIFLTHAHMGHYTGLLHLGREAYGVATRLFTSPRMAAFLTANAPWSAIATGPGAELVEVTPGQRIELTPELSVEALPVPHRDEYSDTYAWLIHGPTAALLYLPDIDKWERWSTPIESLLDQVDIALLDGSFYGPGEIPGRDLSEIPHPFIVESLTRFESLAPELKARIYFTHLNHTNPAADPSSAAATAVRDAGMHMAGDLDLHRL